jgi:branched-subunit amino acid ABC-type transport system permease component
MPDLKPFLVLGFALGGVFAMSGVGLVVLYRATGVLNLAYGAIGATGALITWSLLDAAGRRTGSPTWPASSSAGRRPCSTGCCSARRSRPATRWSRRRRRWGSC